MQGQEMAVIERPELELRLLRARARIATEPPFSPDWDAAMAEVESLEKRLLELEARLTPRPAPPAPAPSS
jgi:hypothetical protein